MSLTCFPSSVYILSAFDLDACLPVFVFFSFFLVEAHIPGGVTLINILMVKNKTKMYVLPSAVFEFSSKRNLAGAIGRMHGHYFILLAYS